MTRVLSLDKSLDVLEAVFASNGGIGTRALAKALDLNVATIHNIAMTLVDRGYLRQDPANKAFLPGLRMMLMGRHPACHQSLLAVASELVENVAQRLNESVMLAMVDHHRVVNLKYVSSRQALRVHEPEDVTPISYCTAVGKLLLASLDDKDLDRYLAETHFEQFTPDTITDPAVLRRQVETIRETGCARSCNELEIGVTALAVPILAPWGSIIAGLGSSAPTLRLSDQSQIDETFVELRRTADAIASAWQGDPTQLSSR
ncbi:MAG: IclR family transcriptional regulator [Capsulimonadaceae bacterium]|nr:IclR family transcriptional regulator [Capsulimonadaceae bacterium]